MRSLHTSSAAGNALAIGAAVLALWAVAPAPAQAPASSAPANAPVPPDWALPGSAAHKQVPPPRDFHRPSVNLNTPLGIFEGISDIGGPLVPGSSRYDASAKRYSITSAGYNIWYSRDEFRFIWKRMSGDVSFAADVSFPNPAGYNDRKVVLVIRQDLDDDSKEVMVAEHGRGMVHLAQRPTKGADMTDMEYTFGGTIADVHAARIGIEKHGDSEALYVRLKTEPMHQFGPPAQVHFDPPFYVGIGFCSHQPVTPDTAEFSDVLLENAASWVR